MSESSIKERTPEVENEVQNDASHDTKYDALDAYRGQQAPQASEKQSTSTATQHFPNLEITNSTMSKGSVNSKNIGGCVIDPPREIKSIGPNGEIMSIIKDHNWSEVKQKLADENLGRPNSQHGQDTKGSPPYFPKPDKGDLRTLLGGKPQNGDNTLQEPGCKPQPNIKDLINNMPPNDQSRPEKRPDGKPQGDTNSIKDLINNNPNNNEIIKETRPEHEEPGCKPQPKADRFKDLLDKKPNSDENLREKPEQEPGCKPQPKTDRIKDLLDKKPNNDEIIKETPKRIIDCNPNPKKDPIEQAIEDAKKEPRLKAVDSLPDRDFRKFIEKTKPNMIEAAPKEPTKVIICGAPGQAENPGPNQRDIIIKEMNGRGLRSKYEANQ